ncbi:MAG: glycoside hydrolase family 3 C-terminal domain-containing protein [Actinomycetota bacterium]
MRLHQFPPSRARYRAVLAAVLAVVCGAAVVPVGLPARPARAAECPWMETSKSPEQRARELLAAMTIDDKINMVGEDYYYFYPYGGAGYIEGNPDLCLPDLTLNDGPSGVANAQVGTTAWPTGMGRSSTWDPSLGRQFGEAIGQEAWNKGVNVMLMPAVNIGRIPMNGRNFEYMGEDPFLAGEMAVQEVKGVQASNVVATVKHYAVNNQENNRDTVSADVDDRTMHEIYLPAFEATVKQGRVGSAMCSYNRFHGIYACENPTLLNGYLKKEFGFDGWVMTDWGAQHSTVAAANAGLDMEMSGMPASYFADALKTAVQNGQVPASRLNDMVLRILRTMFRIGLFDHPVSHTTPGPSATNVSTADHLALARKIAEDGTVLLKNEGSILPLEGTGKTIAVIGQGAGKAASQICGGGGSSAVLGCNTSTVTPLQAIEQRALASADVVIYADGSATQDAVLAATAANVAIVFGYYAASEGSDRTSLALDSDGDALIAAVAAANPNTIVVLNTGGPTLMPWLGQVKAVLEAWFPGQEDGNAIAAVLFGDAYPSGRLPQTFPKRMEDLATTTPEQYPGVNDKDGIPHAVYSEGVFVGYRHYDTKGIEPLFPFGFGLSYTSFRYDNLRVEPAPAGSGAVAKVSVEVTNTGKRTGAEVAQLYLGLPSPSSSVPQPPKQLKGFDKLVLAPGETKEASFLVDERAFSYWDTKSYRWVVAPGCYQAMAGGSSRDLPLKATISRGGADCGAGALVLDQAVAAGPAPARKLPATGATGLMLGALALVLAAERIRRWNT